MLLLLQLMLTLGLPVHLAFYSPVDLRVPTVLTLTLEACSRLMAALCLRELEFPGLYVFPSSPPLY